MGSSNSSRIVLLKDKKVNPDISILSCKITNMKQNEHDINMRFVFPRNKQIEKKRSLGMDTKHYGAMTPRLGLISALAFQIESPSS